MIVKLFILTFLTLAIEAKPKERFAKCDFGEDQGSVWFRESKVNGTRITEMYGEVLGLADGGHAFHIHVDPVTDDDCATAGGHFDPYEVSKINKIDTENNCFDGAIFCYNRSKKLKMREKVLLNIYLFRLKMTLESTLENWTTLNL